MAALLAASVFAQPVRILLLATVCKIFKVDAEEIKKLVLDQAKDPKAGPTAESIKALAALVTAIRGGKLRKPSPGAADEHGTAPGRPDQTPPGPAVLPR
ncbi:hypothetical protein ACIA5C_27890 [Actinoplanes sp. NPDC051343]|uniref:hypothetical protein n=1 Tax=Actinoplanes sp. NPDC051343 TaxID=3363906 RepID=UPI0037B5ACD4